MIWKKPSPCTAKSKAFLVETKLPWVWVFSVETMRTPVPNIRPVIASVAILLFISSWNEYLWPLLVTRSAENSVIQIGLQMFLGEQGNQWGALMAAATLASLPILLIYLVLQRQIIDTFVRSGLR